MNLGVDSDTPSYPSPWCSNLSVTCLSCHYQACVLTFSVIGTDFFAWQPVLIPYSLLVKGLFNVELEPDFFYFFKIVVTLAVCSLRKRVSL